MMRFGTLLKHPADWMISADDDNAVVLTSRIRLARNLQDQAFPGWSTKEKRCEALETLLPAVQGLSAMKDAFSQELSSLSSVQKQVLVERHLISREQAARGEGSAAAYDELTALDTQLESELNYAFDQDLGYLTACPSNLGTGMRASAMLHLPGLVLSDQVGQVLNGIGKLGLAVRGLFGEGTESLGNLFQISNQSTLGESEGAIIRRLERVLAKVAQHEKNARQKLLEDDPMMVNDKVGRAFGVLRNAYVIDSKEALNHLSLLRLGADLEFLPKETKSLCDALLLEIQPAHLQLHSGKKLSPEERDILRAEIIRVRLQSLQSPVKLPRRNTNGTEPANPDSETN